jgi:hypothetical protein
MSPQYDTRSCQAVDFIDAADAGGPVRPGARRQRRYISTHPRTMSRHKVVVRYEEQKEVSGPVHVPNQMQANVRLLSWLPSVLRHVKLASFSRPLQALRLTSYPTSKPTSPCPSQLAILLAIHLAPCRTSPSRVCRDPQP